MNECVRIRALPRRVGATVLRVILAALLTACIGETVNAPEGSCPSGSVRLESGCIDSARVADDVRGIMRDTMNEYGLRSAIAGVSVGGVPVITEALGESATGETARVDMHWRNGAIAIPYMTTVLLQLADREALRLDEKLAKWFPHYPNADRITLAMLANNTSGYADYVNLDLLPILDDPYRQWTPAELLATAFAQPMVCDPGTCFAYAHTNYVILGQVLSLAAGKPLATLIREGVLAPLRLNDTRSEDTPFIAPPVLHAFTSERGRYEESTDWNPSWTLAEGAIMTSSVPDVLRSAVAIGTGELVSAPAFAQFIDPTTAKFPGLSGSFYYGLGVIVTSGWITQTPSFFGYSGVMAYLPEHRIAVALASTMSPTTPDNNVTLRLFQRIATRLAPSHRPALAGI